MSLSEALQVPSWVRRLVPPRRSRVTLRRRVVITRRRVVVPRLSRRTRRPLSLPCSRSRRMFRSMV